MRGQLGKSIDPLGDELRIYTHHMLVVRVDINKGILVVHKTYDKGAVIEYVRYQPVDVTRLVYDFRYTGRRAIMRAYYRLGESYDLISRNCEHFVTEVRTGAKQSIQVQNAVFYLVTTLGLATSAIMICNRLISRSEKRLEQ